MLQPVGQDKRGRQRYSITAAGKREFLALMRSAELSNGAYRGFPYQDGKPQSSGC